MTLIYLAPEKGGGASVNRKILVEASSLGDINSGFFPVMCENATQTK